MSPAQLIATAFLHLGIARLSGRPLADPGLVPRTRGLLAQASVSDPSLGDLAVILDAFAGALEVPTGNLNQAVITLTRGADRPRIGNSQLASADCAGQLALIEAYRGNLREAARRASSVLAVASEEQRAGVAHAHLGDGMGAHGPRRAAPGAGAAGAQSRARVPGAREPWLVIARHLVEARLLIASARPDEAMRLAASPRHLPEGIASLRVVRRPPHLAVGRGLARGRRAEGGLGAGHVRTRDRLGGARGADGGRPAATSATCVARAPPSPRRPTTCQVLPRALQLRGLGARGAPGA